MSLLDANFIDIDLYYKYVDSDSGKRLVILDDEKAKETMKLDVDNVEKIEKLTTKWALLTWQEQNDVMNVSSQTVNPQTGERQFNFLAYRDAIVKKCLKEWNLTVNEKPIPVSPDAINKLPGSIVANLYTKFEGMIDYSEEEMGN